VLGEDLILTIEQHKTDSVSIKVTLTRVDVAIGIQHATRMRHIMLSSVACLAVLCFSTLHQNRQKILEDSYWDIKRDFFYKFALKHFLFEEEFGDIIS